LPNCGNNQRREDLASLFRGLPGDLFLVESQCQALTRKQFLTYIAGMVTTLPREPDVFMAISHPARRQMLDLLAEADSSVNTLAGHFQMSRPAVSQHLRVLLDSGLVTEQRHGRERHYHFVPEQLALVREWIARYERFWDDRLQRLQAHLLTTRSNQQKPRVEK